MVRYGGFRWCGGTGRRPGLKIPWALARAGSIPATSTSSLSGLHRSVSVLKGARKLRYASPPLASKQRGAGALFWKDQGHRGI